MVNHMFTRVSVLNQDRYQVYNRYVAEVCDSVNAAIMLSELVNRYEYHTERNEILDTEKHGDGWFYYTADMCYERTRLTIREQSSAIKILEEKGFISCIQMGMPCKRHFKMFEDNILEMFGLSRNVSSFDKNAKQVSQNQESAKPVSTKTQNKICEKRKTAPIYKELQEDLHKTTSLEESRRSLSEKEKKAIAIIDDSLKKYQWTIDFQIFEDLILKYGILYVVDQVNKMIDKEFEARKHAENPYREVKTKPIEKPESYLRMSCEKNWASSKNIKKSKEY